jgi:carbon monoxide dehydrogenase subunit G
MALQDIQAPESYTIQFDGQAARPDLARGPRRSSSRPKATTLLTYAVHAQVGGKIAQIGSRLVDAAARKMADTFFTRFTEAVGGGGGGANGDDNNTETEQLADAGNIRRRR